VNRTSDNVVSEVRHGLKRDALLFQVERLEAVASGAGLEPVNNLRAPPSLHFGLKVSAGRVVDGGPP
jgi:hypothetical protein